MVAFEDFAEALSQLNEFEDSMRGPDAKAEATVTTAIDQARKVGADHLAKMEEKCLAPKWEIVRPVLYKDEGYWF